VAGGRSRRASHARAGRPAARGHCRCARDQRRSGEGEGASREGQARAVHGTKAMKITRDVIIDLLPAVASGEASADTRLLVEEFLASDPELKERLGKESVE